MTGALTVALVCPACGAKLEGSPGDVAFACPECGKAWEIEGPALEPRDAIWPRSPRPPDLRIPFWSFDVEVAYSGDDRKAVAALSRAARPGRVFVPAFRQRSAVAFGDMGISMTFSPPAIEAGEPSRVRGATLGSGTAARLVAPMVLWRADQVRDVTGIEISARVERVALACFPAVDVGDRVAETLRDREWPASAFMDIASLRGTGR